MRTSDAFEDYGYFWLPASPENRVPGLFRVKASGRSELELMGVFGKPPAAWVSTPGEIDRVLGELHNGRFITLEGCNYTSWSFTLPGGAKCSIKSSVAYVGAAFDHGELPCFTKARFSFEGLDDWLAISGIEVEPRPGTLSTTIHFDLPSDISCHLPDDLEFKISFGGSIPSGHKVTEAKVTQTVNMNLISSTPRELDAFVDRIFAINHFLCFGIDKNVDLTSLAVFSPDAVRAEHDGTSRPVEIDVFYESRPHAEEPPVINVDEMLFRYQDVATNLKQHLMSWLDILSKTSPAYYLYFSSKSGEMRYLSSRFLTLAQGVEALHRRCSDATLMPQGEFEHLVELLVSACPEPKQQWLKQRLKYANEATLRRRLTDLLAPFKDHFGNKAVRKKLVNDTANTRNYFTHYDESLASEAAEGRDLWRLCERLEALFQLHLMKMIGFEDAFIEQAVQRHHRLNQKLRQD